MNIRFIIQKVLEIICDSLKKFDKYPLVKGDAYICVDNSIGDFTVGKVYHCRQDRYLEDDYGVADVMREYKRFHKCFKKVMI